MENRINQVVELENGKKYFILKQAIYLNENYFIVAEVTEDGKDLKENFLVLHEIKEDGEGGINVKEKNAKLEKILEEYLQKDITLIPCAGGDKIASEREQWNDGSNTLAIAPGVVIVYDRNNETNEVLRNAGLKVLEMHSAELSRGRGGPRCMSMPLIRED